MTRTYPAEIRFWLYDGVNITAGLPFIRPRVVIMAPHLISLDGKKSKI